MEVTLDLEKSKEFQYLEAAVDGDMDRMKLMVEQGADIRCQDSSGYTALHTAAYYGHAEMVQYIVTSLKLNIHEQTHDECGAQAIHLAAQQGHVELFKYFLELGIKPAVLRKDGWSLLHCFAHSGDLDAVKSLVDEYNLDVHHRASDAFGHLPIQTAAERGRLKIVKYFLEKGVDKDVTRKDGWTLLHCAAYSGHLRSVKFMVEGLQLDVNQADTSESGALPIHVAAGQGSLPVVKYLLEQGVSKDAARLDGWSLIHEAAYSGCLQLVEYMVEELQMDVNQKTTDGTDAAPIHLAAQEGYLNLIQYLISQGADPRATLSDGRSALHLSANSGHLDVVKFCVEELHLDTAAEETTHRNTPLSLAALGDREEVLEYLQSLQNVPKPDGPPPAQDTG